MSTPESTVGSAPRGIATMLRAADAVDSVGWIAVLRVALGALYVSVFFDNLAKHLYGASGYAGLIREYAGSGRRASGLRESQGATRPDAWRTRTARD